MNFLGFIKECLFSEVKDRDENLSANFKVKEFLPPDVEWHELSKYQQQNIKQLVIRLEKLRVLFNKPFYINTPTRRYAGFRTIEQNAKVDGAKNSYHMKGMASDIAVPNGDLRRIALKARELFGGVILYEKKRFIHLDIRDVEGKKYHPDF